jgi:hypothetical protein
MTDQINHSPLTRFLPFIKYNLFYPGFGMYMNIRGGSPTAPVLGTVFKTGTDEQRFSLDPMGKFFYIRNCLSQKYITPDIQVGTLPTPTHGFAVKQDVQYDEDDDLNKLSPRLQQWKFTQLYVAGQANLFIITSVHFPHLILQPKSAGHAISPLVLVNTPDIVTTSNTWRVIPFN